MADELQCYHQHQCQVNINSTSHENDRTPANAPPTTSDGVDIDCGASDLYTEVLEGRFVEKYKGAAQSYGCGATFMDVFDGDPYASEHINNLYHPFTSKDE